MTNVGYGLVVFLFAFGTFAAAALIYGLSILVDVVLDVPAPYPAAVLSCLSILLFVVWSLVETTVAVKLFTIVGSVIGLAVLTPLLAGSIALHGLRRPNIETLLRYAIGAWGPSVGAFIAVLWLLATQDAAIPLAYAVAAIAMVATAAGIAVGLFDRFHR